MTPFEMKTLAERRFGGDWLRLLASETAVNERTVRRWADGTCRITGRVESHILHVCGVGA
jgi:hypothetical protein